MIAIIKKYSPMILLLMILILLPFDWYRQLFSNKNTFILQDVNGIFIFTKLNGIILIIYLYTVLIQLYSIHNKNYYFIIFSDFVLIVSLILFPASMYPINIGGFYFLTKFTYGFYLALALIICSLIRNIQLSIILNHEIRKGNNL